MDLKKNILSKLCMLYDITSKKKIAFDDKMNIRLLRTLFLNQIAAVRTMEEETQPCSVGRCIRQGCSFSPILFSA